MLKDRSDPAVITMEGQVTHILEEMGIDTDDENFIDTPIRWLRYLRHYCQSYNPKQDIGVTFQAQGEGAYDNAIVVQTGIPYRAICAHHLVPVLGTAHVGYIPEQRVVGLSKLTRVVQGIAHKKPSLQEDVCNEVTDAFMEHLKPLGAMCVIHAEHGCMAARGVEESCVQTATASVKGVFIDKIEAREEFYKLIQVARG